MAFTGLFALIRGSVWGLRAVLPDASLQATGSHPARYHSIDLPARGMGLT